MVTSTPAKGRRSPAISRGMSVITELSTSGQLGLAELAARVGLAKSSASDVCSALVELGVIQRSSDGRYRLGQRISTLAQGTSINGSLVRDFVSSPLDHTALDGHTLSIATIQGIETLTLNVRLGRHPLPLTPRPGTRSPATDSAVGIALIRALSPQRLKAELDAFSAHQGTSPGQRKGILDTAGQPGGGPLEAIGITGNGAQLAAYVPIPGSTSLVAIGLHLPDQPRSTLDIPTLGQALSDFAKALGINNRDLAVEN